MLGSVCITRQGADAGKGAGLEQGAVAAAEQRGMGLEEVQQLRKVAAVKRFPRLMPEPSSSRMDSARPCLTSISCAIWSDFSRLTGPPKRRPPISRKTWLAM